MPGDGITASVIEDIVAEYRRDRSGWRDALRRSGFRRYAPGTMTFLDADSEFDTMSYCSPNWISDHTFNGIYEYLVSNAAVRPQPSARRSPPATG